MARGVRTTIVARASAGPNALPSQNRIRNGSTSPVTRPTTDCKDPATLTRTACPVIRSRATRAEALPVGSVEREDEVVEAGPLRVPPHGHPQLACNPRRRLVLHADERDQPVHPDDPEGMIAAGHARLRRQALAPQPFVHVPTGLHEGLAVDVLHG